MNRLAREIGVSPTTINDVFKPKKHTLSSPTIAKIEDVTGIPRPPRGAPPHGFAEPEAVYLPPDDRSRDAPGCPRTTCSHSWARATSAPSVHPCSMVFRRAAWP
jgi:hypothetical protein